MEIIAITGMQIAVLALVFLAVVFAAFGVWMITGSREKPADRVQLRMDGVRQIKSYELGESLAVAEKQEAIRKVKKKEIVRRKAFSDIPVLDRRLKVTPWATRLAGRLRQAQLPLTVSAFVLVCLAAAGVGGCLAFIWRRDIRLTLLVAPVFGIVPYMYVTLAVRSRLKRFNLQFPDALDLLSSSVKGGLAFNAAVQNVADEMPDPIADEFRMLADELSFGIDTVDGLNHLSDRLGTQDVKFFCTALIIQKETGGNLSEILDGLQQTIRERLRILGHVRTLTAQGRLSGWVVGLLPVALGGVIYMLNPDYMSDLFTTDFGHKLLMFAGTLQVLGMLIIRKIVNIKV